MDIERLIKNAKFMIFDFDGTIANTSPLHEAAFQKVFEPFQISINYCQIAGKSTKEAIYHILSKNNLELEKLEIDNLITKKQFLVREEIKFSSKFKPIPNAKEFIQKISQKYTLGIASSGSRQTIELALKRLDLIHYFKYIVCSEDVKKAKPSPEIFLKIINLAKFTREEALIFEDSYIGIKASKAAKIPVIDVTLYPYSRLLTNVVKNNEIS